MIVRHIINLTRIKKSPCFYIAKDKAREYEHDIIYGINPVEAAIHANRRTIVSLMISDSDRIELSSKVAKLIHLVRERNIPVSFAPKEKLNRMVDHQPHQNLILKCSKLPLNTWSQSNFPQGISVYCDKITDPQNFGAILRSALFFGASAVFTGKKNHCPLNSTVSKTSSGAMELMNIYGVGNSTQFIANWKNQGGHVVATGVDPIRPHSRVQQIRQVLEKEGKKRVLLILGSEGKGVSSHLLTAADFTVMIERKGSQEHPFSVVDSLNVSAAASTILFELTRD